MKQKLTAGAELDLLTANELQQTIEQLISGYLRPTMPKRDEDGILTPAAGDATITLPPVTRGMEVIYNRVVIDAPGSIYTAANLYQAAGAYVALFRDQELLDFVSLAPSGGATQTPISSSQTGAATALTATLNGAAGATTYITGFEVTGSGATAGTVIQVTVAGLATNLAYYLVIPAGVGTSITPLIVEFPSPIPASAPNTAITVSVPSFGAGNTNAAVTAHGYQLGASPGAPTASGGIPYRWTWSTSYGLRFRDGEALSALVHIPPAPANAQGLVLRAEGYMSPIADDKLGSLLLPGS